ncbi:transaldolase [Cryptococcus neoformans Bt1]|nr:transaldolase [Cryptococcus neoformans var. grubii Bt1]
MPVREPTLLEQLENAGCKIDIDSFDPEIADSLPFTPHDATSNQALIRLPVFDPKHLDLVKTVVRDNKGASPHDILTILHAKFAKILLPHISEKIVTHAKAYAKAFNDEGIPNDRFCIKIPTTTAGVQAAVELNKLGIASLGTALFSLPQAIAASQAGMHAISPYFNPCKAHADPAYWVDTADPIHSHPMANRMIHIRETYDKLARETGKPQPQIKGAGYITGREVMAQAALGCDHVTVLPASIKDLLSTSKLPPHRANDEWGAARIYTQIDQPNLVWENWSVPDKSPAAAERLAALATADPLGGKMQKDFKIASTETDYLADGVLDEASEKDEATKFRLADAIETFKLAEDELFEFLAKLQKAE